MELGKPALSILPSERSYTVIFLLDEVQVLPRVFDLKSIHGALRTLVHTPEYSSAAVQVCTTSTYIIMTKKILVLRPLFLKALPCV